ncbi:MAG: RNA-binding domain-containing protein [Thermoprotei archaeon]
MKLKPTKEGPPERRLGTFSQRELDELRVGVSVRVYPTESPEAVRRAVLAVVDAPLLELEPGNEFDLLTARNLNIMSLTRAFNSSNLHSIKILRALARRQKSGSDVLLYFNKQAATVGRVAVCSEPAESPLGPITVSVRGSTDLFLEWLDGFLREGYAQDEPVPSRRYRREALEDSD